MHVLSPDAHGIDEALRVLREGGVVAHATETCYGLACDLSNPVAVARLFRQKRRPEHQPISALFPNVGAAKEYVEWNARAEELAKDLPGPLTLVLPLRLDAPKHLFPTPEGGPTIGVRVSPHPTARALVTAFGSPISTTSANLHGEPNPYRPDVIVCADLLLDDGELPVVPSSRVIDCTSEVVQTLRP